MLRVGEVQSTVFDWESCIFEPNGEVFENAIHRLLDQPLDVGRLFYAKLRYAGVRNVEVFWNHFDALVTGVITGRQLDIFEITFSEPVMSRTDKIVYIETIVSKFKETQDLWQQSRSSGAVQQDSSVLRR